MRPSALLLAALLLAPIAAAGSERSPEVVDGPDSVRSSVNLISAWFDTEPDGLRFTIKVESVREPQPDKFYLVGFDTANGERIIAGMGWDRNNVLRGYAGDTSAGTGGVGVETFANAKVQISHTPGTPAYFTGLIPWGAIDGVERGERLEDLSAAITSLTRATRTWRTEDASERADITYQIQARGIDRIIGSSGIVTAVGVGLVVAVGVAAFLLARRTRGRDTMLEAPPEAPAGPPPPESAPTKFSLRLDPRDPRE